MRVQLDALDQGTIFQCNGKEYRKGGICGPIIYRDGKYHPWLPDDAVDQRVQGVRCAPKLGGVFQTAPALHIWFPNTANVMVT